MKQVEVFSLINDKIRKIKQAKSKPIRVAVNGIEGTGKTTFAISLVGYLNTHNQNAFHITIDGFHFNKKTRYRQGRNSAKGYYEDAYDEKSFVENVLLRSQGEPPEYIAATHDLRTDAYLNLSPETIDAGAILVTDGCYLLKPIFNKFWDLRIYLKTDFETALGRGVERDQVALGGYDSTKQKFEQRYHAASKRYISEVNPQKLADMIVDISDFKNLLIV